MSSNAPARGPTAARDRITSLDAIRGVATLGILAMNAVEFGLAEPAYANVSADGISQPLDWVVGVVTMIFVDQKMMALFSLLFGAGVVMFADRARIMDRRVVWLSLWRLCVLLGIGIAHSMLWDGDILGLYAIAGPIVLVVHKFPAKLLIVSGVALALTGSITAPVFQMTLGTDRSGLGDLWLTDARGPSSGVQAWLYVDASGRALGFMLLGVGLYRLGIIQGQRADEFYRRMARWGIGAGIAITASGLVFRVASDWSPDYALTGYVPTGIGAAPMAIGYMALIIMWNRRNQQRPARVRNVGRMALTNYLTQTILGVTTLTWWWGDLNLSRTTIGIWIIGVWTLQCWWSTWWLDRVPAGPGRVGVAQRHLPQISTICR